MASLSDLYVIAAPLDHPEGIATGPDGELYAGGEAGQVYRIDQAAGAPVEIANTGGFALGLAHDAAGMIYVCNISETPAIVRVNPDNGDISTWCDSADGAPLETPNWCAFAPDGTLWFTDSGTEDLNIQNGRLIRVPRGRRRRAGGRRRPPAALPQRHVRRPGRRGRVPGDPDAPALKGGRRPCGADRRPRRAPRPTASPSAPTAATWSRSTTRSSCCTCRRRAVAST